VFSFTKAQSQNLGAARRSPQGRELQQAVADILKLPGQRALPDYRILRSLSGRKYPKRFCACYAVETEPGIQALVYRMSDESLVSRPPQGIPRAMLYIAHHSSDAELRDEPLLAELIKAEPDTPCYACDVRGIGESRPDTCGKDKFLDPYGSDYFYSAHSLMLDRPLAGQKTFDVLQVLDWLASNGHREVHLVAKGWGALPATFAALLSPLVVQVTLKNALASYQAVAEAEEYAWPLSSFLPDVLRKFDLPDCYRALAAKRLRMIEPWGPMANKANPTT
jgi:pimeloyl-ACP methyl ester carboxylesterase